MRRLGGTSADPMVKIEVFPSFSTLASRFHNTVIHDMLKNYKKNLRRRVFYASAAVSRIRTAATWARLAVPRGASLPPPTPLRIPCATAQPMDSAA